VLALAEKQNLLSLESALAVDTKQAMTTKYIVAPPHEHTGVGCKACLKWIEYQKAWYFDLEHNFEYPPIVPLGYFQHG